MKNNLDELPSCVLLNVLEYLDPKSLALFLLVSHKFRTLSSTPFLWSKVIGGLRGYLLQKVDRKRFGHQRGAITLKVLVLGGLECNGREKLMHSIAGLHPTINSSPNTFNSLITLNPSPITHVYNPVYVCLSDFSIIRLLLFEVSDPSQISSYQGYHFVLVLYDTCNIFSLIEEAKHLVKELDKSSTLVKSVIDSHHSRIHLPVFLLGCKSLDPREDHCDLKMAKTLIPLFKFIRFCGCNEFNVNSYEEVMKIFQRSVETCLELMGWTQTKKESVTPDDDYFSVVVSDSDIDTKHDWIPQTEPIEMQHESNSKCNVQ